MSVCGFRSLWREFGAACVGEEEAARFDEKFIQPLDESDNTGCDNDIAKIIGEFNPGWDTEQDYDGCFKSSRICKSDTCKSF